MRTSRSALSWLGLVVLAMLGVHLVAGCAMWTTIELMRSQSPFALTVRAFELELVPFFNLTAYLVATAVIVVYLWPLVRFLGDPAPGPPSAQVRRRAVTGPLFVAACGFAPYPIGVVFFVGVTVLEFGRWAPELASQQVLSPLVNGFLAMTLSYLLLDWIFRARVMPRVFPHGGIASVEGAWPLGVQARLWVFLMAVAFLPLFTMLGLVRAAVTRMQAGLAVEDVMAALEASSQVTFLLYVVLGVGLTFLLGRTLTRPLHEVVSALRRIQRGDLRARVGVDSGDELGVLEEGVNAMAGALRDREHIFQTFGRVVEPSVRDQLLAGAIDRRGELRRASILFCDIRGFTALAEHGEPGEVVDTLNDFFTVMTAWVRACGGFVEKFIGDAMLVVFGLFEEDAAARETAGAPAALRCGMGMRDRVAEINARRTATGLSPLAIAIGIHTGEVLAGTIGAEDRHEYTVIGDTVNVAARLEQLCKERGRDLLVSEAAYRGASRNGTQCQVDFEDSVTLRGRAEPVRVFGITA